MECLGKVVWHVLPVIVAAVLGGIVINRFFVRKSNVAALVDRACNRLDELRQINAKYWIHNYSTRRAKDLEEIEARIKSEILHIQSLIRVIKNKYGHIPDCMDQKVLNLQDVCTGGDFESKSRKADKKRYMRIVRTINALSVELQQLKL